MTPDTTNLDIIILAALCGFSLYVAYRILRWIVGVVLRVLFGDWEFVAADRLNAFDQSAGLALEELLDGMGFRREGFDEAPRPRRRVTRMRDLQNALAEEAYFEFGYRRRDEANELITRKFMRDLLRDRPDLRAADARVAIDGALALSFLPTRELQLSNVIHSTWAAAARRDPMGYPLRGGVIGWLRGKLISAPQLQPDSE